MPLMKEKKFRIGGLELALAAKADRADRIQNSTPYRLAKKAARMLRSGNHGPAPYPPRGPIALNGDTDLEALRERVRSTSWYHTIDLGGGLVTDGMVDPRPVVSISGLPEDLSGKRVIDVGTCDGFWAFELERRGAEEVVAIDLDSFDDYDVPRQKRDQIVTRGDNSLADIGLQPVGEGFRLAKEVLGSKVQRQAVNVYDLSPENVGMFDVSFVGYLLVHLRDPQTALENIFSITKDYVVLVEPIAQDLEDFDRPLSNYVGTSYLGMWWEHNSRAWKQLMKTAGFHPIEEVSRSELDFKMGAYESVRLRTIALKGHVPTSHR